MRNVSDEREREKARMQVAKLLEAREFLLMDSSFSGIRGVKLSAESRGCASAYVCTRLPRCAHSLPSNPRTIQQPESRH